MYFREGKMKNIHFDLAAESDDFLWYPDNVTHQFLIIPWGNSRYYTNDSMVIVHFYCPLVLDFIF